MSKEIQELGFKIDNRFDKLDSSLAEQKAREFSILDKIQNRIENTEVKITNLEKDFAEINGKIKFQDWKIVALFILFVIILITIGGQE